MDRSTVHYISTYIMLNGESWGLGLALAAFVLLTARTMRSRTQNTPAP